MRYLPKSDSDRDTMLAEIGAGSIDDLFSAIPDPNTASLAISTSRANTPKARLSTSSAPAPPKAPRAS